MRKYCPTFSLKGLCRHRTRSWSIEKFRQEKIGDRDCCERLATTVDSPVLHRPTEELPERRKQIEDTAVTDGRFVRVKRVDEPQAALSIMKLLSSRHSRNN